MFRSRNVGLAVVTLLMTAALGQTAEYKLPSKAKEILAKADQIELYSLWPKESRQNHFHGWKVLGKTILKGGPRKRIIAGLEKGIADSDGQGAKCFDPRHGIRAIYKGKTLDLVICFRCDWVYVYYDKESKEGKEADRIGTTRWPEPALDNALKNAGVPLANKASK